MEGRESKGTKGGMERKINKEKEKREEWKHGGEWMDDEEIHE